MVAATAVVSPSIVTGSVSSEYGKSVVVEKWSVVDSGTIGADVVVGSGCWVVVIGSVVGESEEGAAVEYSTVEVNSGTVVVGPIVGSVASLANSVEPD